MAERQHQKAYGQPGYQNNAYIAEAVVPPRGAPSAPLPTIPPQDYNNGTQYHSGQTTQYHASQHHHHTQQEKEKHFGARTTTITGERFLCARSIRAFAFIELVLCLLILACAIGATVVSELHFNNYRYNRETATYVDGYGYNREPATYVAPVLGIIAAALGLCAVARQYNRCRRVSHLVLSVVAALAMAGSTSLFTWYAVLYGHGYGQQNNPSYELLNAVILNAIGACASFICFILFIASASMVCCTACCGGGPPGQSCFKRCCACGEFPGEQVETIAITKI